MGMGSVIASKSSQALAYEHEDIVQGDEVERAGEKDSFGSAPV